MGIRQIKSDGWLRIVMAGCVVAFAISTWWSVHSTRVTLQPILDQMIAECKAGSQASYCKRSAG